MILIRLDEAALVAGQIAPEDMEEIAAAGVGTIVNNRPDGEQAGQPEAREIEQAAERPGSNIASSRSQAESPMPRSRQWRRSSPNPPRRVLAFCRSGTRSTYLWALARSRLGRRSGFAYGQGGRGLASTLPRSPHFSNIADH
jgi:uncharacterized protein (TIGR01244 family)